MSYIVECTFLSCFSFMCICLCYQDFCMNRPVDRKTLTQRKLDEVIVTYKHTPTQGTLICPITQDEIEPGTFIKELPCGHKFSECVNTWLSQGNRCPVCREEIIVI